MSPIKGLLRFSVHCMKCLLEYGLLTIVLNKRSSLFYGPSLENNAIKIKYHVGILSMNRLVLACVSLSKPVFGLLELGQDSFLKSVRFGIRRVFAILGEHRNPSFGTSQDFLYQLDVAISL